MENVFKHTIFLLTVIIKKLMFYPSLTSTDKKQIETNLDLINKLNVTSVCLFLTCLEKNERTSLYEKLKQYSILNIPFVHLRSDVDVLEIEYLIENFSTKVFNIHSQQIHPLKHDLSKYKSQIYIENDLGEFDEKSVKEFAGICIDFSHLEHFRKSDPVVYNKLISQIEKFPCKCGHVSAIKEKPVLDEKYNRLHYDFHYMEKISEMDYIIKYKKYFPQFLALELENNIEEQLKIINYLNRKV
jgi:hypothetical protein